MSRYHTKTSTNQSAPGQPSRNLADLGPDSAHPRRHRTNEEWVAWLTGPLPLADRLAIEIDAARAEEQRAWDAEARFTPDVVAAVHTDGRRLLTIPPPITGHPDSATTPVAPSSGTPPTVSLSAAPPDQRPLPTHAPAFVRTDPT